MSERNLEDDKLLTMNEALAYLKIGRTTMYRLMDEQRVKGYKVRCTWRFYLSDLISFVKGDEMAKEAMSKDEQG